MLLFGESLGLALALRGGRGTQLCGHDRALLAGRVVDWLMLLIGDVRGLAPQFVQIELLLLKPVLRHLEPGLNLLVVGLLVVHVDGTKLIFPLLTSRLLLELGLP